MLKHFEKNSSRNVKATIIKKTSRYTKTIFNLSSNLTRKAVKKQKSAAEFLSTEGSRLLDKTQNLMKESDDKKLRRKSDDTIREKLEHIQEKRESNLSSISQFTQKDITGREIDIDSILKDLPKIQKAIRPHLEELKHLAAENQGTIHIKKEPGFNP